MSGWVFVLARDPASAKTRLAAVLRPAARAELASAMLADVIDAAVQADFDRRFVVTESSAAAALARARGLDLVRAKAEGTNAAAREALRAAAGAGAKRVTILAADLPLLGAADLALLTAAHAEIVIAPDRHERGTNALVLASTYSTLPAFGIESFRAHRERAERMGIGAQVVRSIGLATDVDTAEDLDLVRRESAVGSHTRAVLETIDERATASTARSA